MRWIQKAEYLDFSADQTKQFQLQSKQHSSPQAQSN